MVAVTCSSEIQAALAADKIAAILGLEGADGLGHDLELLRILHRLGVRIISLTWNHRLWEKLMGKVSRITISIRGWTRYAHRCTVPSS